jgi:fibronectin type 3 domain-containing protein
MHTGVPTAQGIHEQHDAHRLSLQKRGHLFSALLLCCMAGVLLTGSACGRKGDPFLSKPLAPQKVRALTAVVRPGEIVLQWQAPRDTTDETGLLDLAGFYVYRARETLADYCVTCPRSYELVFNYEYRGPRGIRPDKRLYSFSDQDVALGFVYMYRVVAYSAAGTAGPGPDPCIVHYDTAPRTPRGFKAEQKNKLIVFNWQPSDALADGSFSGEAIGYRVYRRLDAGEFESPLNAEVLTETFFEDTPPADDTVYFYTLRSVRTHKQTVLESEAAPELRVEYFDRIPPEAPRFLTAIAQKEGVLLKWMAKTDAGFAGYNVYRRTAGRGEFERLNRELVTANSWLDTTAVKRQRYEYVVTALDDSLSANESRFSDSAFLRYILN